MTRWRVPLGFLVGGAFIFLAPPPTGIGWGLMVPLVLGGCAIRSWAAGYLLKGKRLAVGGPYAYVRNPLYTGSFLLGAGFCASLFRVPLPGLVPAIWVVFLAGFWWMYRLKSVAEEGELALALGESFQDYRRRVPAFFPWRGRIRGLGDQRFSWELYRRNREYQCVMGVLAVIAVLVVKSWAG